MKEPEDEDSGTAAVPGMSVLDLKSSANVLRLVDSVKRESLLPDPRLKTVIEEMKERQKSKRVRLTFDDGPEAA